MSEATTHAEKTLRAALWYAELGLFVVPGFLDEFGKKRPWLSGWSENASVDTEEIRGWWRARPDSIVGICCGMSNVIVVDIDVHDEMKNGYESLNSLVRGLGKDLEWFDSLTVMSRSGGGGKHYVFKAPDGIDLTKRKIEWRPGIDILIGGSFVVLPPSRHPSGTDYAWEVGLDSRAIGELPHELVQDLLSHTDAINPEERVNSHRFEQMLVDGSESGARNNDLIRLIGWLRRKIGDTPDDHLKILEQIELWRDRCSPPYRGGADDDEFQRTWVSGLSMPHADFVDWFKDALTSAGFDGETTRDLSLWMEPRIGGLIRRDTNGELFVWDGKKWVIDDPKHITSYGMLDNRWSVIDAFQRDTDSAALALEHAGQTRAATRLRQWSARMRERAPMVDAMRMVVGRQEAVRDPEWDPYPHYLHCVNGVLDLRSGVLLSAAPELMNRCVCPTAWNPAAKKPVGWMRLLDYMLPGDVDMQRYLLAALGFSLWGDNHQKAVFVLHGDANNGKSTLTQTFLKVIGIPDSRKNVAYGGLIDKKVMAAGRGDQHPAGLADALLKRVGLMSSEWGAGDVLNLELVKAITGDDMLSARFMREDFGTFMPKVTPWINTNHAIQLREFDASIRARLKLIELPGVIPEKDRKPSYEVRAELEKEAEGFLNAAVQEMLKARGLGGLEAIEPESLRRAVEESIDEQDEVMQWGRMRLTTLEGDVEVVKQSGLTMSEMHRDFVTHYWPMHKNKFAQDLTKLLKVSSRAMPMVSMNGVRERRYPVRWNDE